MIAIVGFVEIVLTLYSLVIFGRILLAWLPLRSGTLAYRVYSVLYDVSEPYLSIFRRFLPLIRVGNAALDVSPAVGLVVLLVVERLVAAL